MGLRKPGIGDLEARVLTAGFLLFFLLLLFLLVDRFDFSLSLN